MSQFPLVSVLFITYKRVHLLRRTLETFVANTAYPNLELVVTDDASPLWMQKEISELPFHKHVLAKKRRGLGANANEGLRNCAGEFVLFLQDDWECRGPETYLAHAVRTMQQNPAIGLVRFYDADSGVNSSHEISSTPLSCRMLDVPENISDSNRFLYSDTPHLRSKLFNAQLGPYREDLTMEACETEFAQRFLAQSRFSAVYFPAFNDRVFVHIGQAESFRTNSLRYRWESALSDMAQPFRGSALHQLGTRTYRNAVRLLAKTRLLK
jgi:glycosyltransferase involved in cell wall biosynthesis